MRKLILAISLCVISAMSFATSKQDAVEIYDNILKANNIKIHPSLEFSSSSEINAYQSGYTITLNQGILNATNKNELALVIGHELGHFMLHHLRSNHSNEYAADAAGAYYASKAGYSMCKGKELFKKFKKGGSDTHPDPVNRYKRIGRC